MDSYMTISFSRCILLREVNGFYVYGYLFTSGQLSSLRTGDREPKSKCHDKRLSDTVLCTICSCTAYVYHLECLDLSFDLNISGADTPLSGVAFRCFIWCRLDYVCSLHIDTFM
jgi:hypothetical protein